MKQERKLIVIAVLAVLSQLLAYAVFGLFQSAKAWYVLNAFTHIVLWVCVFYLTQRNNDVIRRGKWGKRVVSYGVLFALNQFLDELFFDPTKLQLNEIILLLSVVTHLILKLYTVYATRAK